MKLNCTQIHFTREQTKLKRPNLPYLQESIRRKPKQHGKEYICINELMMRLSCSWAKSTFGIFKHGFIQQGAQAQL